MSDYGPGRKNQYFVPGEGIAREVITADVCKYLDNDATVRPMNYQGRDGFMLYAYRNLTSAMIEDLKKDTVLWEKEQREKRQRATSHRNAGPGIQHQARKRAFESTPDVDLAYVDSRTHQRRQDIGPTVPETPSPGIADGYPPGRGPPGMGYNQHPSPQNQPNFPAQRTSGGYPNPSSSPAFTPGYPTAMDTDYPARPSQDYGGYPGNFSNGQPPMGAPARGFPPQPPQTAPPVASRDPRDPRYEYADPRDTRSDPRGMPHGDPRQFPPDRAMDHGGRYPVDPRAGYDARGYSDARGYRR